MRKYTLTLNHFKNSRKPIPIYNSDGEMIGYTQRFIKNGRLERFLEYFNHFSICVTGDMLPRLINIITKDIHGNVRCKITANNDWGRQTWSCEKTDQSNQKIRFSLHDKSSLNMLSMMRFEYEINGEKVILKYEKNKRIFRNSNQELLAEVIKDNNNIFNGKFHVLLYSDDADVFEFCSIFHAFSLI